MGWFASGEASDLFLFLGGASMLSSLILIVFITYKRELRASRMRTILWMVLCDMCFSFKFVWSAIWGDEDLLQDHAWVCNINAAWGVFFWTATQGWYFVMTVTILISLKFPTGTWQRYKLGYWQHVYVWGMATLLSLLPWAFDAYGVTANKTVCWFPKSHRHWRIIHLFPMIFYALVGIYTLVSLRRLILSMEAYWKVTNVRRAMARMSLYVLVYLFIAGLTSLDWFWSLVSKPSGPLGYLELVGVLSSGILNCIVGLTAPSLLRAYGCCKLDVVGGYGKPPEKDGRHDPLIESDGARYTGQGATTGRWRMGKRIRKAKQPMLFLKDGLPFWDSGRKRKRRRKGRSLLNAMGLRSDAINIESAGGGPPADHEPLDEGWVSYLVLCRDAEWMWVNGGSLLAKVLRIETGYQQYIEMCAQSEVAGTDRFLKVHPLRPDDVVAVVLIVSREMHSTLEDAARYAQSEASNEQKMGSFTPLVLSRALTPGAGLNGRSSSDNKRSTGPSLTPLDTAVIGSLRNKADSWSGNDWLVRRVMDGRFVGAQGRVQVVKRREKAVAAEAKAEHSLSVSASTDIAQPEAEEVEDSYSGEYEYYMDYDDQTMSDIDEVTGRVEWKGRDGVPSMGVWSDSTLAKKDRVGRQSQPKVIDTVFYCPSHLRDDSMLCQPDAPDEKEPMSRVRFEDSDISHAEISVLHGGIETLRGLRGKEWRGRRGARDTELSQRMSTSHWGRIGHEPASSLATRDSTGSVGADEQSSMQLSKLSSGTPASDYTAPAIGGGSLGDQRSGAAAPRILPRLGDEQLGGAGESVTTVGSAIPGHSIDSQWNATDASLRDDGLRSALMGTSLDESDAVEALRGRRDSGQDTKQRPIVAQSALEIKQIGLGKLWQLQIAAKKTELVRKRVALRRQANVHSKFRELV